MIQKLVRLLRREAAQIAQKISSIHRHFTTALRNPLRMGSLFPSSRYVAIAVVRNLPSQARNVVEYGPGTGAITKALLHHLPSDSHLIGIELNSSFVPELEALRDQRLQIIQGGVLEELPGIASKFQGGLDAIVSGIPFSTLPAETRENIVEATRQALRTGGRFVTYQNTRLLVPLLRKYFRKVLTSFEPRNIFPYFILVAEA